MESLALRFRCTDGSERQLQALPNECIRDLKSRAFEAEMALGMDVCCFYQGRSLRDESTAAQNSRNQTELESGICVLAMLRRKKVETELETPYIRMSEENAEDVRVRDDGSNWDFLCGLLFGFLLNFIVVLFVLVTQLLSDQLNRRQKLGLLVGIGLSFAAILTSSR